MAIVLNDVVSNNNTSVMNANFAKIEDAINEDLLKREIEEGEANEMRTHVDMNFNKMVNMFDGVDPGDATTLRQVEDLFATVPAGEDGADGTNGTNGTDGIDGEDGATGAPGAKGDTGDTGAPGAPGADGADGTGIVNSVVAGTNVTVDATDPANPIVSATGGTSSPLTTKGDVYTYDTAEQRLAVGTDGQVLTADSSEPTGLKFATPAAGGVSGSGSHLTQPVASGFWRSGVQGTGQTSHTTNSSTRVNVCQIDMIYFDGTEVISDVGIMSNNSAGGTLRVGLHPIVKRGLLSVAAHTAEITIATGLDNENTTAVGWTPAAGWYYSVIWASTAIAGLYGGSVSNQLGNSGNGLMSHQAFLATSFGAQVEGCEIRLYADHYGTDQDLTPYDLVTKAKYKDSATPTVNGDFSNGVSMVVLGFKVA
jgi:hypothetical protein